jgi:plasmid stabilization system protein ParE
MGQVIWTDPALGDVQHILRFVARDSPRYAEKLADRFREAPRRLAREPRTGWQVPEYERDDVREILVSPYRLIYVIRGDDCYIVTAVHGSRDLARHWRPEDFGQPPGGVTP